MTKEDSDRRIHWDYLLAIEKDLEALTRYIEFCEQNYPVYSMELAHLLFAASSEVDVIAKLLCKLVDKKSTAKNICQYMTVLNQHIPQISGIKISVPRYGLSFSPWEPWANNKSPKWWHSYNEVKHERNLHFHKATLENVLNSMGALLIMAFYYYMHLLSNTPKELEQPSLTMHKLRGVPSLIKLPDNYYHGW